METPNLPDTINNWEEAIELTIQLHEYAEENDMDYRDVQLEFRHDNWEYVCPLCQYVSQYVPLDCCLCLWIKFTGYKCHDEDDHGYDYADNKESIERLKEWKEKIKQEE